MVLNLRRKLILAFSVVLLLTAITSLVGVVGLNRQRATVEDLFDVEVRITELSQQANINLTNAKNNESDYLLHHMELGFDQARQKYIIARQTKIAAIHTKLDEIRQLESDPEEITSLDNTDQAISAYEVGFLDTIALIEKRGNRDSGIEGLLEQKANEVETVIQNSGISRLIAAMLTVRRQEKDYMIGADAQYVTELHASIGLLKTEVELASIPQADKTKISKLADEYQVIFNQLIEADSEVAASMATFKQAVDQLGPMIDEIDANALASQAASLEALRATTNMATKIVMGAGIGALLAGFLIAITLANSISDAAKLMSNTADHIADIDLTNLAIASSAIADGDLTRAVQMETPKLKYQSSDEMGDLAKAFNKMINKLADTGAAYSRMIANLNGLIRRVAESAISLSTASSQLAAAAEQSGQAANQITITIQQVARGTAQQSEAVSTTAASVEKMSGAITGVALGAQKQAKATNIAASVTSQLSKSIQQVAGNAQHGVEATTQATSTAREGVRTVEETLNGMQSIQEKVNRSTEKVEEMGQRSGQIGAIVETIDEIASQTNLLALNAAIEAARAGEHGKGFAVVADEVRKLAEKSAAATKEISALIKAIQQTVSEAVKTMMESNHQVEQGVEQTSQSSRALESIIHSIEAVNSQVDEIATAANQMNELSQELVGAVDSVSEIVEHNATATQDMASSSDEVSQVIENIASVSEENSAAVEEVSASTEEMTAQVEEVTASAQSLADMAQELQDLVAQFKLIDETLDEESTENLEQSEEYVEENSIQPSDFSDQSTEINDQLPLIEKTKITLGDNGRHEEG